MRKYTLPDQLTIPKLKRSSMPHKLAFVDTETKKIFVGGAKVQHILKMGCATFWRRADKRNKEVLQDFEFNTAAQFWKWVTQRINKHETIYLFAHNVTFDFLVLEGFQQLPRIGFILKSLYYKFTTSVIRFENDTRRLVIVDTMNYFPVTLEKLGHSIGIEKVAIDFDDNDPVLLAEHCRVDVSIIYNAIRNMVDKIDVEGMGSFKVTAPSMAASYYRKTFMKHKIVTNHKPEVVAFEREAYTGAFTGISNLVEPGRPELYKLDVNSMYPAVMMDNKFPTQLMEFAERCTLTMLERFLIGYMVVARVQLHTDIPYYPCRSGDTVFYPVGEFTTTLTTPLLKHAIAHGHIEKVEHIAVYQGESIFSDYVSFMYGEQMKARELGDIVNTLFYKTLNRTLYGKFGQKMTETKRISDADPDTFAVFDASDPVKNEHWKELHAGGSVMFIYERGEARYTSFAISAHITDYARLRLFDLAHIADRRNVFYMDTDSLIVNDEGKHNLRDVMNDYGLGALKIEDTGGVFIGFSKKDYILGNTSKMKGFTADGKREDNNILQAMQNVGFYSAAKYALTGGAFWQTVNKHYNPTIGQATIEKDGSVSPLNLPRDADLLKTRHRTIPYIKDLMQTKLSRKERNMVSAFVGL